ncbi:MAG: TIGR00282 family metallophosphoesterase [Ruminococcaceae bacterium]|nr:TIGR00282 family metallophosphoesterase [Oscillospiraceae bacterium]
MELKVLAVGDVVGDPGLERIRKSLRKLKRDTGADFVIVNGENASNVGMTPRQGDTIFDAGADVITMGNHTFSRREIIPYIEENRYVLRPANLPPQQPGRGWEIYESRCGDIAVIDLIGRVGMDYLPDNPFLLIDKILKRIDTKIILVEIHAEATSEKLAMGYMLDGRVSAVWGTHTHVPTADPMILPKGTGYVTDLGMTGPAISVIGIQPKLSIDKFRGEMFQRYQSAEGPTKLNAVLFTIDAGTGKCTKVERVDIQ